METHDSVDAFVRSREGLAAEQLKGLGVYSTKQTGESVERRLLTPRPLTRRKALKLRLFYGLLRMAHRDVVLFVVLFVALLLTVNAVWRP